jgi:RNA polymerase sigma-70 factor (ECF subfamily)
VRSDAELIREARNDPDAFGDLYQRHARLIARWFAARAPARMVGELTAETFAQASLSLRRFRDEADGSATPWLHGIARNVLRRTLERERVESAARRRLGMPLQTYEADLEGVAARLDAESARPALEAALEQLPPSQRNAIELRVLRALSYDEIAASLGCSQVAARIRVMRALDSLSRMLRGVVT